MVTFDYNPKGAAEALSRARAAHGHVCSSGELVDLSGPGPFRCRPESWDSIIRAYGNAFVTKADKPEEQPAKDKKKPGKKGETK